MPQTQRRSFSAGRLVFLGAADFCVIGKFFFFSQRELFMQGKIRNFVHKDACEPLSIGKETPQRPSNCYFLERVHCLILRSFVKKKKKETIYSNIRQRFGHYFSHPWCFELFFFYSLAFLLFISTRFRVINKLFWNAYMI